MDFEKFGIAAVMAITVLCYVIAQFLKNTPLNNKWLPAICGLAGALFGILGYYVMPDYPAQDILTAAADGAVSGFAATGINQVYKQLQKNANNIVVDKDKVDEQEE